MGWGDALAKIPATDFALADCGFLDCHRVIIHFGNSVLTSKFLDSVDQHIELLSDEERARFALAYRDACSVGRELDIMLERKNEVKGWVAANIKLAKQYYFSSVACFVIISAANFLEVIEVPFVAKWFVCFSIGIFGLRNEIFAHISRTEMAQVDLKIRSLQGKRHIKYSDYMAGPYSDREVAHDKRVVDDLLREARLASVRYPNSLELSFLDPD